MVTPRTYQRSRECAPARSHTDAHVCVYVSVCFRRKEKLTFITSGATHTVTTPSFHQTDAPHTSTFHTLPSALSSAHAITHSLVRGITYLRNRKIAQEFLISIRRVFLHRKPLNQKMVHGKSSSFDQPTFFEIFVIIIFPPVWPNTATWEKCRPQLMRDLVESQKENGVIKTRFCGKNCQNERKEKWVGGRYIPLSII